MVNDCLHRSFADLSHSCPVHRITRSRVPYPFHTLYSVAHPHLPRFYRTIYTIYSSPSPGPVTYLLPFLFTHPTLSRLDNPTTPLPIWVLIAFPSKWLLSRDDRMSPGCHAFGLSYGSSPSPSWSGIPLPSFVFTQLSHPIATLLLVNGSPPVDDPSFSPPGLAIYPPSSPLIVPTLSIGQRMYTLSFPSRLGNPPTPFIVRLLTAFLHIAFPHPPPHA